MPNWEGGGLNIPLSFFLHSCSDKCSATFLKILCPSHLRSGHRVRSRDPTSEKSFQSRHGHSGGEKIWNFQDLAYYQVPAACLSRIFFLYRWPKVRSIVWPPLYKSMGKKTQMPQTLVRSVQIVQNHAQLGYCWWPRFNDPWKGHLWSNNDIVRTMYVFAYNFWLDWKLR